MNDSANEQSDKGFIAKVRLSCDASVMVPEGAVCAVPQRRHLYFYLRDVEIRKRSGREGCERPKRFYPSFDVSTATTVRFPRYSDHGFWVHYGQPEITNGRRPGLWRQVADAGNAVPISG